MYDDYIERLEKISIQLGEMAADRLLEKDLSKYLVTVNENIAYINSFMDDMVANESGMQDFLYALGYNYYRMRQDILNSIL